MKIYTKKQLNSTYHKSSQKAKFQYLVDALRNMAVDKYVDRFNNIAKAMGFKKVKSGYVKIVKTKKI